MHENAEAMKFPFLIRLILTTRLKDIMLSHRDKAWSVHQRGYYVPVRLNLIEIHIFLYKLCLCIISASEPGLTCTETTSNDDNDFGNMVVGEQVTLTCQTTFYGLWRPTQIWFDSRGQILSPSDVSVGNIIEYINTVRIILTELNFWNCHLS